MDFTLDQKHEMARTLFKDFAENEAKPLAQETDETEVFPQSKWVNMDLWEFRCQSSMVDRDAIF